MKKTVLIIGATGMLGNAMMMELSKYSKLNVYGTVRDREVIDKSFSTDIKKKIITRVNAQNIKTVESVLDKIKPETVINCVGQLRSADDPKNIISGIYLNSLFPHHVAALCTARSMRLIHISTDAIFSGRKGHYREGDVADAQDFYGRTKFLGEISAPHLTIRTSILGHGFENHNSLIDWFLEQKGSVQGYRKMIYSGLPTPEVTRIMAEFVIFNEKLTGIYHIASKPISKYQLLKLVAKIYHKKIKIIPDNKKICNLSLDSRKFRQLTSYKPLPWEQLIKKMYDYYLSNPNFIKYSRESK